MAESNGDLKKTWQTLKQAMNREGKSNSIDKLNVNGNEINDKMKIAESCNEYFTDIGRKLASEIPLPPPSPVVMDPPDSPATL